MLCFRSFCRKPSLQRREGMSQEDNTALEILRAVAERARKRDSVEPLDPGTAIHLIEQSRTIGQERSLEGNILVERPDGSFHRISGRELAELAERFPEF